MLKIILRIFNLGIIGNQVSLEEKHSIRLINQTSFFIIILTTLGDIGEIGVLGWQLIVHTIVFKLGFILVLYLNFKGRTKTAPILFSSMLLFELCSVPFLVPHTLNADGLFLSIIVLIGAVSRKASTIIIFAILDMGILIGWHVADSYSLINPMHIFKPEEKLFIEISYTIVMISTLLIGLLSFKRSAKEFQTELTQTNLNLEYAFKDLERQHLLNQKIFSVISHDFRGPMLSLGFMLDKFRQKSNDTGLNEYVKEVNTEVNNANVILNNLLNWARTEINIKSFEKNSALVNEIAGEMITEFKTRLQDKALELNVDITQEATVNLPPDILRITLRNLISNAIKFSKMGGKIELTFSANSLKIKDTGIGISPEKQSQLFKKEVDTELGTGNEEGFGMGLYIVSELLYKYKYSISVESNHKSGTVFTIEAL